MNRTLHETIIDVQNEISLIDNFPMNIQKYKIGGRKDNNGHWVWTDGQPVLHTYWAPGK